MPNNVLWSGSRAKKAGTLSGPNDDRTDGACELDIEMKVSPLPICPKCNKTETVFNPQKGPYPSRWGCIVCNIEWGHGAFPHTDKWESAWKRDFEKRFLEKENL